MKQDLVAFNLALKGKTIKKVAPLSPVTADLMGWYKIPWVIEFTDGTVLIPQSDDEGNDGGAMLYVGNKEVEMVLYTFSEYDTKKLIKEMRNDK